MKPLSGNERQRISDSTTPAKMINIMGLVGWFSSQGTLNHDSYY